MNDNKWIKLHSKMLNWEWYKNANVTRLFVHCLLKANWKDGKFQGKIIQRGSFVTGRKQLSKELGMTEQEIRTALNHLKSTNEITITPTNKYSIITVTNYELYQMNNQVFNQQSTNNQPATNQQVTTIVDDIDYIDDIDIDVTTTNTRVRTKEQDIFSFTESVFGRTLGGLELEIIGSWEDNELTRYAIKQTELARAFNVRYVQSILESYKKDGIRTVTEAEERDRRWQEQHKTKKSNTDKYQVEQDKLREKFRKEDEERAKGRSL